MRSSLVVAVSVVAALGCLPLHAQTNVYRWVDSQGKVHFSDTPPPEQNAKGVTRQRLGGGQVEEGQLPFATQLAMKKSPVVLYTAPKCGDPCTRGRTLLSSRGIPYAERDAQANPADAEALKKLIGALQVPVILIGEEKVKGFDENAWHAALDTAGYPRTRLPGTLTPKPVVKAAPPPPPPAPVAEAPSAEAEATTTEPAK
jgi:glutaredoxin